MNAEQNNGGDSPTLKAWLTAARDDLAARAPPAWLEFQLRERFAERSALQAVRVTRAMPDDHRPVAGSRWITRAMSVARAWLPRPALAAAASVCVAVVIGLVVLNALLPPSPGAVDAAALAARSPFIALTSLDAIAAESGATVVPARLPRTSLLDFGLPVDPARADVPLDAEFLMSPRGVVLAVRFIE